MSQPAGSRAVGTPQDQAAVRALRARHARLLLLSIVAVSLNMRMAITGLPPLVERIGADTGLSRAWTGALTALPVLCMGVFAPVAQRVAHRWGREAAVLLAVAAVTVGCLLRLGGPVLPLLYAGTLVAGVGIAVGGTILPGVVKEFFPERSGAVTGLYMLAMMGGAAFASAVAVPLADALGSWPASLATWAAPAAVGVLAWLPVVRRVNSHRADDEPTDGPLAPGSPQRVPLPWRHPTAWFVAAFLAFQSFEFYSQLAWISPLYESIGWTPTAAGLLLAVFSASQIVSGVAAPVLTDRVRDRRPLLAASVAANGLGLLGLVTAPALAPWLWVSLIGLGLGGGFALALVLLVDYAATPAASARLSGMCFLMSYGLASVGPSVLGLLRDATGSYDVPFALLLVMVVLQSLTVVALRPDRARTP